MLSSNLCCTSDKAYKFEDGWDDAEDDEPNGFDAGKIIFMPLRYNTSQLRLLLMCNHLVK